MNMCGYIKFTKKGFILNKKQDFYSKIRGTFSWDIFDACYGRQVLSKKNKLVYCNTLYVKRGFPIAAEVIKDKSFNMSSNVNLRKLPHNTQPINYTQTLVHVRLIPRINWNLFLRFQQRPIFEGVFLRSRLLIQLILKVDEHFLYL